jgi:hypothetical protein
VRHPTTKTWTFADRPIVETLPHGDPSGSIGIARTNLRELAARPDRLEHHLVVVGTLGIAQLELATASEPLYFAHVNISDEFAVPLPTGDPLLDAFPMRTFVSDATTGADLGRYNHKCGDLVLHPVGHAHWPGKLRPPYEGMAIPPGMRRCGLSLVYCASVPTPSTTPLLPPPAGRAGDVKPYAPVSLSLASTLAGPPGVIARIGATQLELVEDPTEIAPPNGGWVIVLATRFVAGVLQELGTVAACDLLRVPAGARLPGRGIARALVLTGDREPDPVPATWRQLPPPPFAPLEDAPRGELPFSYRELRIEERSPSTVAVLLETAVSEVPRHWLARMLYRIALHDLRLNVVETYGGLFVDDSGSDIQIGLRTESGRIAVAIPRAEALGVIERLYRAVAPPDYRERIA